MRCSQRFRPRAETTIRFTTTWNIAGAVACQHMLAHGFQVLIQTAAGAGDFPYMVEDSLIGFLDQSSRFLKPVYSGDTLYPALEVAELKPNRNSGVIAIRSTVHNQRSELVMEGTQRYLVRKQP